jgi:hypothetical protein
VGRGAALRVGGVEELDREPAELIDRGGLAEPAAPGRDPDGPRLRAQVAHRRSERRHRAGRGHDAHDDRPRARPGQSAARSPGAAHCSLSM